MPTPSSWTSTTRFVPTSTRTTTSCARACRATFASASRTTATVPDDVVEDAVAVVREALANVARHARAHDVVVRVQVGSDLAVEVQDDGVGIPAAVARRSGLANLENRAARRGGSVSVRALPEGGTHLRWSVPLS